LKNYTIKQFFLRYYSEHLYLGGFNLTSAKMYYENFQHWLLEEGDFAQ